MGLPREVAELIERFERNRESYLSGQYNETQLRREFLDPFFTALGWDVENKQGYAEAYKDVIHEDALKIGGATKAPDYCFRVGSVKKFFVEAKKPSVNLKDDVSPAFQLRRYAWSAKLPLSILTDFEEFVVYDCRIKPVQTDKASTGRVLYFTYTDYAAKWDELVSIFSRDAVLKGSFDKYAESSKLKKGTATVDDAFLTEIEDWRDLLARNIAIRNPDLSQRELNFAVQRTIDRIVFLRICEDRGIEEYGRLQMQLNGTNVYKRLVQLFSQADERYNSGLFHFQREKERHEEPDKLTPNIAIDDKPLKDIINRLYYPESPYEFSVLSADILGQVYEQFLGKVIRLTAGHQAKVEEKPEVRKAGGVYYTPKYIVDYIVKNTVGKLLSPPLEKGGKGGFESSNVNPPQSPFVKGGISITPKEASKLRILDPACGSGSFLLGAYQYLLDWHLKWYIDNEPEKWAKTKQPSIYQGPSSDPRTPNWHLTTAEKKRILLNNIYGVDIDSQAVEVTKLSLLLKVLEGESNQTLANQLRMFHERALPDLGDNIKCGNSLIGPDFYQQQTMLDDEERLRVNVFDWNSEFSEIMKGGGFDAVIGNPPYGATFTESDKQYLDSRYSISEGNYESFAFFIEKSITILNGKGLLGFIIPDTWLSIKSAARLRKYILDHGAIRELQVLNQNVFNKAKVDVCTIIISKSKSSDKITVYIYDKDAKGKDIKGSVFKTKKEILQTEWEGNKEFVFTFNIDQYAKKLLSKINNGKRSLSDFCLVGAGCKPYELGKGNPPQTEKDMENKPYTATYKKNKAFRLMLRGNDIGRYDCPTKSDEWLSYGEWLAAPRNPELFNNPRLLFQSIRNPKLKRRLIGTYIDDDSINNNSITNVIINAGHQEYSLKYFLGIMNSEMMNWYFAISYNIVNIDPRYLKMAPIPSINFKHSADKARHDKMVSLVEQMLSLNKQLPPVKTDHEKTALQRQIVATDQQIDQLVYELYGLTAEEIKIVEDGNGP